MFGYFQQNVVQMFDYQLHADVQQNMVYGRRLIQKH